MPAKVVEVKDLYDAGEAAVIGLGEGSFMDAVRLPKVDV